MLSPRTLSWSTCHSSTGTNQRAHPRGHPWRDAAAVSDIVGNLGGSKRLPWHMAHMATDVYVLYVDVVVVWWLLRLLRLLMCYVFVFVGRGNPRTPFELDLWEAVDSDDAGPKTVICCSCCC